MGLSLIAPVHVQRRMIFFFGGGSRGIEAHLNWSLHSGVFLRTSLSSGAGGGNRTLVGCEQRQPPPPHPSVCAFILFSFLTPSLSMSRHPPPGMMIRPKTDTLDIQYNVNHTENWEKFVTGLNKFLEGKRMDEGHLLLLLLPVK